MAAGYADNAQFREYDSECGRLSTAIAERWINVRAYRAYPTQGYRKEHDMSIKSAIEAEIAAARRGEIVGAHFGIVCGAVGARWIDCSMAGPERRRSQQGTQHYTGRLLGTSKRV